MTRHLRHLIALAALCGAAACTPEPAAQEAGAAARADDLAALGAAARTGWDAGAAATTAVAAKIDEEVRCTVYWEQWMLPISEGRTPEALLAAMPEPVRALPAGLTYRKWSDRFFAAQDRLGVSPGDGMRLVDRWNPVAAATVDRAVKGDRTAMGELMAVLGACRNV